MKTIKFIILGNHKDPVGNPVPKLKMTGKQHWMPKALEYSEWKHHVIRALLEDLDTKKDYDTQRICEANIGRVHKPIVLGKDEHAQMILRIKWNDNTHGDPENIFGAIADALFWNDKNVDCKTISSKGEYGMVEVTIHIFETEKDKLLFIK